MCKYCKMHAKGYEKWYLNPEGYNEEFFYKLSKLDRILHRKPKKVRLALQDNESVWYPLEVSKLMDMINIASKPIIGRLVKMFGNYLALHTSGGQVVPLEF